MSQWLIQDETPFQPSLLLATSSRSTRTRAPYAVVLRAIRVLNNRRLFFSSDVLVYTVVVDGYPDVASDLPVWTQTLSFSGVKDGANLSIDPESGYVIYQGRPRDFLNVYLLAVRDTQTTREFTRVLKENMVAAGVATLAGAAVSIFAGLPAGTTVSATRDLITGAVNTTLDYFIRRKDPVIGVYYGSLLKQDDFRSGLHPANYPTSLLSGGDALEIGYEVRKGD